MVIGNAQVVYAELMQHNNLALKYKTNYQFWQLMLDSLADEKVHFLDNMREYTKQERVIRKKLKRNKKMYDKMKRRIDLLKFQYKTLTQNRDHDEHS